MACAVLCGFGCSGGTVDRASGDERPRADADSATGSFARDAGDRTKDAGDTEDADGVGDAEDDTRVAPPAGPPWECPEQIGSCPAHEAFDWELLLKAEDYGPDAVFVAGTDAVLVHGGDPEWQVLRLGAPDSLEPPERWVFPEHGWELRDVAMSVENTSNVTALACRTAGGECAFWKGPRNSSTLVAAAPLPEEIAPNGLVADQTGEELCVYGNGIHCFDGEEWRTLLERDVKVLTLVVDWSVSAALDEAGGVWISRRGKWDLLLPFERLDVVLNERARRVDVAGSDIVFVGEHSFGRVSEQNYPSCSGPLEVVAGFVEVWGELPTALTRDGAVLSYDSSPAGWCEAQRIELGGPVIDTGTFHCGTTTNPRVLTASQLWGMNYCPIE